MIDVNCVCTDCVNEEWKCNSTIESLQRAVHEHSYSPETSVPQTEQTSAYRTCYR